MSHPIIYKAAQARLEEIWDYTLVKWGEEQADKYLRELAATMRSISTSRHLWKPLRDKRLTGVSFIRSGNHVIFFREIQGQIAIISILHQSMDILQRLLEDLPI